MRIRTCLALLIVIATAWAADPIAELRFADGKPRTLEQFKGQALVVVYACAH